MKAAIFTGGAFVGFLVGLCVGSLLLNRTGTEYHWKVVNDFRVQLRDRAAGKPVPGSSLCELTVPHEFMPSLAALVEARELEHADLVFPNVARSREVTRHWMRFCDEHPEIVWMTGAVDLDKPLHVNIWYRPAGMAVFNTLVRELQAYSMQPDDLSNAAGSRPSTTPAE